MTHVSNSWFYPLYILGSFDTNVISNRTCLSIPNHSSIPKVSTRNNSSMKSNFEDFKSSFTEMINVQKGLFMNQEKELFLTEMNLFKNTLFASLKHNTSHSHQPSNGTDRIISLLQDQIEFLQEQLRSKHKFSSIILCCYNLSFYKFSQRKVFQK